MGKNFLAAFAAIFVILGIAVDTIFFWFAVTFMVFLIGAIYNDSGD
jgi:hypothetical protein